MKLQLGRIFWISATVAILFFTLVMVGRNLIHAVRIKSQIRELERQREHYTERITRDSTLIEQLRYDDYLEEYAREHFRMQRSGDEVYLLEEE